jgi:iron complex transport system ATP-binding protein
LDIEQVSFAYDGRSLVVAGVSAALTPGKLCALIGPNASGKTTLMRLIMGQVAPTQGAVRIAGRDVASMLPRDRAAAVSYVPQKGMVSFAFTVEQVVAMGRFALKRDQAAIDQALAWTDLSQHRGREYQQLSAGQQQRVLLARAIAQSIGAGRLMLLDEPASMMDLWHVHRTMGTLRELTRQGMAVLVVLHDLNLAARYADEAWLLDGGRLIAAGPWDQVLTAKRLEPVYRVRFDSLAVGEGKRPVFNIEPRR